MRENVDQNNSKQGHFLRSDGCLHAAIKEYVNNALVEGRYQVASRSKMIR